MKLFEFSCSGHKNILATHKNTLEFTKEEDLTLNGDCILGVRADFNYNKLIEFVKENKNKQIKCIISVDELKDEFEFKLNEEFCDKEEIVIRIGEFKSERTLGLRSTKAAKDIKQEIITELKKGKKLKVGFYEKNT